ncbi:carbonic anhydrase [Brevundimonas vancanneytii]|uniref:carbonic anhydrase n=1 Tax=Brevundimonas vancanneytii TaxID=1325724 RepID=A0A4P1K1Q3_9CAUL|nr:Carbonic anhydrase 2 [Brevundimonas vancanneytii]
MIDNLLDANLRWAATKTRMDADYFRRLARLQEPEYLWVGCSDSRVPANEIVGLDPGELFVHRNIANLASPQDINFLSVLQYAVEVLKVRHIIVCGHYGLWRGARGPDAAPPGLDRPLASTCAAAGPRTGGRVAPD